MVSSFKFLQRSIARFARSVKNFFVRALQGNRIGGDFWGCVLYKGDLVGLEFFGLEGCPPLLNHGGCDCAGLIFYIKNFTRRSEGSGITDAVAGMEGVPQLRPPNPMLRRAMLAFHHADRREAHLKFFGGMGAPRSGGRGDFYLIKRRA